MHDSIQPRYQLVVKGYAFLSFAKNMGRDVGNFTKNLSGKLSPGMYVVPQQPFDHAKKFDTDLPKNSPKKAMQKIA